jgi:hypothetical protein
MFEFDLITFEIMFYTIISFMKINFEIILKNVKIS